MNTEKQIFRKYRSETNIKKKKELEDSIVEYYYDWIEEVANRVSKSGSYRFKADELVGAGFEGLIKRIRDYDPDHFNCIDFKKFSYKTIRWEMIRWIDDLYPFCSDIKYRHKKYLIAKQNGLTDKEFCKEIGVNYEWFKAEPQYFTIFKIISLDILFSDSKLKFSDLIHSPDVTLKIEETDYFIKKVSKLYLKLSEFEQKVLLLYIKNKATKISHHNTEDTCNLNIAKILAKDYNRKITEKSIDNAFQRIRTTAKRWGIK